MGKIDFEGVDEFLQAMTLEAERIQRNGPDAVMAGGEACKQAMEETVPVRTGGLKGHIKVKGPFFDSVNGHHCEVFPDDKDPHGERYQTIGAVQEYGRSNMAAQPWMRPVMESKGEQVAQAIGDVLMRD